jgi:hypothetical protein
VDLNEQVLAAATGMHGAGAYGVQCGLVFIQGIEKESKINIKS